MLRRPRTRRQALAVPAGRAVRVLAQDQVRRPQRASHSPAAARAPRGSAARAAGDRPHARRCSASAQARPGRRQRHRAAAPAWRWAMPAADPRSAPAAAAATCRRVRGRIDDAQRAGARARRRGSRRARARRSARVSASKRSAARPRAPRARQPDVRPARRAAACSRARSPPCTAAASGSISARVHAAAGALVGARRIGEAIAHHPASRAPAPGGSGCCTCSARAANISSVSATGVDLLGAALQHDLAHALGERRAAGLARGEHRRCPRRSSVAAERHVATVDLPAPSMPSSVMNARPRCSSPCRRAPPRRRAR